MWMQRSVLIPPCCSSSPAMVSAAAYLLVALTRRFSEIRSNGDRFRAKMQRRCSRRAPVRLFMSSACMLAQHLELRREKPVSLLTRFDHQA